MSFTRAVVCLAFAVAPSFAADIPTELFPPDTRIVIGINLRSLMESPLLRDLGSQAASQFNAGALFAHLQFLRDVDTIVLASTGQGDNAPGVAILHGRFDAARLPNAHLYDGVPILEDVNQQKSALAILDSATAIGGTLADVRAAIHRRGGAPAFSADLAARVEAHAGHDFWGVGDIPEGLRSTAASGQNLTSVDRFDFYASLRDGLRVEGDIHVKSEQDLAKLEAALAMFRMMVPAQQPGGPDFQLRAANGTLHIGLFIPEAELKKGLANQFQARPAAAVAAAPTPARIPLSHPPVAAPTVVTNAAGDAVQVTIK